MNLWCQEQQAVLAAGNTPFPRNLVLVPAWEGWHMKVVGENGCKSLQRRKIIFTPWAPFIKVNYTACNISSPFHVRTRAHQLLYLSWYNLKTCRSCKCCHNCTFKEESTEKKRVHAHMMLQLALSLQCTQLFPDQLTCVSLVVYRCISSSES